ncbi:unnamed protein product [Schistocephalus solidus]|uniref:Secreted protein n=1 Tax=Schistocephalus solidus TaxID=70667 RepID=A0A183SG72_SCHSO|nr:unnamed protein product [Schistocephalus solidus]
MPNSDDTKNTFYIDLHALLTTLLTTVTQVVLADLSARVGTPTLHAKAHPVTTRSATTTTLSLLFLPAWAEHNLPLINTYMRRPMREKTT